MGAEPLTNPEFNNTGMKSAVNTLLYEKRRISITDGQKLGGKLFININ